MDTKTLYMDEEKKQALADALEDAMRAAPEDMRGIYRSTLPAIDACRDRISLVPAQAEIARNALKAFGKGGPAQEDMLLQLESTRKEYREKTKYKPEDARTEQVPVSEQPGGMLYEMSIRFKADAGIRAIDDMLAQCFPGEGLPRLKDALVLRIRQTVGFIPDDRALDEYARILKDQYMAAGTAIDNVRFDGYDYLRAVRRVPVGQDHHVK